MPTKRICILECDYVLENTVHKFPNAKTDAQRRKKWLELIGVEEPAVKYIYLCSNHFSRMQYHGTLLNRDALPDINLHKCTFGTENDIKKPKDVLTVADCIEKSEDDGSNIKTIKVHVELYNRIVKAGFMDLGDENTLNKRRQINTKSCQTEPAQAFTCSVIEYNFLTETYMIRCYFCDQSFSLRDSHIFEKHMYQDHKSIKEAYNQYTVMDRKKLFELRKKFYNPMQLNVVPSAWRFLKEKLGSDAAVRKAISNFIFSKDNPSNDTQTQTLSGSESESNDEADEPDERPKTPATAAVVASDDREGDEGKSRPNSEESERLYETFDETTSQMINDILLNNNIRILNKSRRVMKKKSNMKPTLSICENSGTDRALLDTAEYLSQDPYKDIDPKDKSANEMSGGQPYKAVLHDINNCSSLTMGSDLEQNTLFYKNLQSSSTEDPLCCSDVYSSDESDSNTSSKPANTETNNEIHFRYTSSEIVNHFLDLMKTNTVLCFPRSRCPEKYDLAISNIIIELKMAHDIVLTSLDIRRSINRVKNWFNRMITKIEQTNSDRLSSCILPYPPKYETYFRKCVEFLPRKTTHDKWFKTQSIYTDQQIDRVGIKIGYECEFCKVFLQTTKAYADHMSSEHRKCTVCNLVCKDEITFSEHLKSHLSSNANRRPVFSCPDCHRNFSMKNMLRAHMQRFCTKLPMGANLTAIKNGKTIKVYPCRMCNQTFEASHMRRWHELKHDTPQYKCDLCPKAFYTKFPLEQHYRSHQNLRDFICDVCGKGYTSYKNLYCHQQAVHFRKKSFVCDICGIDVTNQCNLARHKKVVHSKLEKGTYIEYKCKRRGKEYLCRKKILQNRNKPQKYKCKLCCIVFCRYKELLEHKRTHHSVNQVVKCEICGKGIGETYMRRHLRQAHKLADSDILNDGDEDNDNPAEVDLNDFEDMIEVTGQDDNDYIIEEYGDSDEVEQNLEEDDAFNDYEEFMDKDDTPEEIIKAAADLEQNVHQENGLEVTEEDLAYMVFDECS